MRKNRRRIVIIAICLLVMFCVYYLTINHEPKIFTTNVDPINKTISDSGLTSISDNLVALADTTRNWLSRNFNIWRTYENVSNPSSRYVVLNSGMRKEEVADTLARELGWSTGKKKEFLRLEHSISGGNMEGRYNPGGYLLPGNSSPLGAYRAIMNKFSEDIVLRYASSTAKIVEMDTALKIASIIERESSGTRDMRLISGIIWNRIFKNMSLDMDATLQYAKGNNRIGWWPKVLPKDKYITSPYNTYQNKGLPPTPISNVSIASVYAALNPKKTSCIFYLHDKSSIIHCSETYEGHLQNIKKYYR